jgi:hypothetical protein
MDTAAKVKAAADAIGAGFLSPNEARQQFDLKPVKGGASPYLQQQNFSLAALDERDQDSPFSKPEPAPAAPTAPSGETEPGPVPPPSKAWDDDAFIAELARKSAERWAYA